MGKESIMTIPNFDGDRALICPLLDFNAAVLSSSIKFSGTSPGYDKNHNISVVQIADKNSYRLLQKYSGANTRQNEVHFQKVELKSDYHKNGKRILRFVYTLTDVTISRIIMYEAIGSYPKTLTMDLYFREVSFKQY